MLVDTQPATYQHMPASPEVREHWVNSQLIGVMMDSLGPSLLAGALTLPVLMYLMAGEVNSVALVIWGVLMVSALVYRYRLIGLYRLQYDSVEGPQRLAFLRRYQWSWTVAAMLWGGSVTLCYLQASLLTQFVCALVILGQGLLNLTAFSAYLPVYRSYANALAGAAVVGLVVAASGHLGDAESLQATLIFGVLMLVFWFLMHMAGNRLNHVHRSSFELQFSNQELIDSLTLQTRASLRAVATKNRFLASAAHDLSRRASCSPPAPSTSCSIRCLT